LPSEGNSIIAVVDGLLELTEEGDDEATRGVVDDAEADTGSDIDVDVASSWRNQISTSLA
jgi:hypothetical protein